MSESDRWVDVVREGVDCVLRYGALPDSDLVARTVTMLERVTCRDARLSRSRGPPETPGRSGGSSRGQGCASFTTGALTPFEFLQGGGMIVRHRPCPRLLSVTGTESSWTACCHGLGLAQLPLFHIERILPRAGSNACWPITRSRRPGLDPLSAQPPALAARAMSSSTGSVRQFALRDGEPAVVPASSSPATTA
jgi:DNA-binding transcriptional LysR family regulator